MLGSANPSAMLWGKSALRTVPQISPLFNFQICKYEDFEILVFRGSNCFVRASFPSVNVVPLYPIITPSMSTVLTTEQQTRLAAERDFNVEMLPGTELLTDSTFGHRIHDRNVVNSTILIPQPSKLLDDPLVLQ